MAFKDFKLDQFELISFLGKGSFGTVKLVRHAPTNKMYAFKCISKDQVKGRKHIQQGEGALENLDGGRGGGRV